MGIESVLCSLSPKRLALIEDDPEILSQLLGARHDANIRGLLDLDKTWDALQIMLGDGGKDPVVYDALTASTGTKLKAEGAFGNARVIGPDRVAEIANALAALPPTLVEDRYGSLYGKHVHGGFGQRAPDQQGVRSDEIQFLTKAFSDLVSLYREAAAAKHSMMIVYT